MQRSERLTIGREAEREPATSFAELQRRIAALPPLAEGHVRVFRGQATDHPTMKPAGLRGARHVDDNSFRCFAQLLADRLHEEANAPFDQLLSFFIWVRAIAQHYGPGTEFLDVTRSLEVAVWFAMHRAEAVPIDALFGPPGPADPKRDRPAKLGGLRFARHNSTGYVYVFDVVPWRPGERLDHGRLIDLSTAPEVFASSPRLAVQEACLLYAKRDVGEGDLRGLAHAIPIAGPLEDCSALKMDTGDIFPTPSEDHWYRRLLSIPQVHRLPRGASDLELAQSVPVQLYVDPKTWQQTDERLILLEPALLWPDLLHEATADSTWLPPGFDPKEATPILLEFPIFAMTPALDSGQWHHAVLCDDLPTEASAYDPATGTHDAVPLDKVLVEFSPLELVRWDEAETAREEIVFWRGAYVVRERDEFRLWLINQTFPTAQLRVSGPFEFFYDAARREIRSGNKKRSAPIQPPAKTLFVVLTLLRELSKAPIACPFPTHILDDLVFAVRVQGGTARLVRTRDPKTGETLYVVRHPDRDEPFSASSSDGGMLFIRTDKGWPTEEVANIKAAIAKGTARS